MGVGVLVGPEGVRVDRASSTTGEKELRGVGVHVELVIGGDNFEPVVDDILTEDGGAGFLIGVAEPAKSWVYTWRWATRCRRACFFMVFVFQDLGEGWDGLVVHQFCRRS
jgi:hypothetical protein